MLFGLSILKIEGGDGFEGLVLAFDVGDRGLITWILGCLKPLL